MKIAHFRAMYLDPRSERVDLGYVNSYVRGQITYVRFANLSDMTHWDIRNRVEELIGTRNFAAAAAWLGVMEKMSDATYLPKGDLVEDFAPNDFRL
jgi:hypothetical protein